MPSTRNKDEAGEIRNVSDQTDAFEFWKDEREDIYQDFLKLDTELPDINISEEEIMDEVRVVRYSKK